MDEVFAALADPTRRLLLERLHLDNGQTLRQLHTGLEISRQGMAKHVAVLEDAGLVIVKRAGHAKLHFIDAAPIKRLMSGWLAAFRVPPPNPTLDPSRKTTQASLPKPTGGAARGPMPARTPPPKEPSVRAKPSPRSRTPGGSQYPGRPGARGQGKRMIPSDAALAAANRRMREDWEKWKKLKDR